MTTDTVQGNGSPDYWAGVRQGRMMTRIDACCCTFDESGNGPLNVCGAHAEWLREKIAAEREACENAAFGPPDTIAAPTHGAWDRGYWAGRADAAKSIRDR